MKLNGICIICNASRPVSSLHRASARRSWNLIMLSCLARHQLVCVENALVVYEAVSSAVKGGRPFYCNSHYVEVVVLLGQEIERLDGEFPYCGLDDVPDKTMNDFMAVIRTCGKIMDSEVELQEEDVKGFFMDCFRRHKAKIRDRLWKMKREDAQDDSPMGASANPQPEIPVKKRFKESDFTPYPDSHRYFCALCSDLRLDVNMKASSQNKKKNLILLACQLASNNTGSRLARKVYSEICSTRKRVCREHYIESAVFIGDEVKKNTGSVPILGLDTIPLETWQNLFEKIQASGSLIDNEQILEPKDLVYFYYDCLVIFRGSEGWEIYTKEFGCDAAALPSTSGVPSPPSDTSPVNEDCTESPGLANFTVKLEAREHDDEDDLDEREPMKTSTQQQIMCECCICNESVSQRKCCSTSERRETNLLLISCLVMSKSLGLERARSAYSKIAKVRCSVCKGHYTYAGIVVGRELERLQCTLPTHGVGVVLRFTWVDMLMKILAVSVLIDNEVVLSAADVEQFHNECSSGFHTELPPVNVTPKCESDAVEDSETLFNDSAADSSSANSNVKEEVKDFPEDAEEEDDQEAISNHSGDEDVEETLMAENQHSDEDTEKGKQRNRKCILCGFFHPEEEGRAPSSNVRQNVILFSCLVLTGAMKIGFIKGNYEDLMKRHRRYCKQHYVQSGNWIGEQVEKVWGKFPLHGLYGISRKVMAEVLARLQECANEFGEGEQLTADDLAWFYGECLGKYRHMKGWKAEALQNKEDINLAYLEAIQNMIKESAPADSPSEPTDPSNSELAVRKRKGRGGNRLKCAICSKPHHDGSTRKTTFDRMENALLLSALVMKGTLDLKMAVSLYSRFFVERKCICKCHYDDAVAYISQELSRDPNTMPSDNTNSAIEYLLSRLQSISYLLDRNLTLRESCLIQFNKEFVAHPLESRKRKKIADTIVQILDISEKQGDRSSTAETSRESLNVEAGPSEDRPNTSEDAGSFDLRTKRTTSDVWKIARNYTCALCGNFLSLGETCMSGVANTRTLFILYRALKFRIVSLQTVKAFYSVSLESRQRVCWKHFWKTAIYISKFLKKECLSSVQNGLENISQFVLNDMLEDVRLHLARIYESKPLNYDDLIDFLEYNLNSQKARDGDHASLQAVSEKAADEPMFEHIKQECSSSPKPCEEKDDDKRHPSCCGFCEEFVAKKSTNENTEAAKKNANENAEEAQKKERRKAKGNIPARRYWCPLRCGSFPMNEMRWLSMKANQTLTLLCCLCMDNVIDVPLTERLYKRGRGVLSKSICEYHYVQAAAYIGKEMEYMYGEFPRDGLQNVPKDVIEKFAYRVRLYRDQIDSRVSLTSHDIVEFFNDCLARYYKNDAWMAKKTVVGGGSGKGSSKKKVRADNSAIADDCQGDDRDQEETASEENPSHLEEISAADLLAQSSHSSNISAGSVVEETTPSFVWLSEDYSTNRVPKLENSIVSEGECNQSHPRASTEAEGELHTALPPLTAEERFDRLRICAGLLQRSNKESLLSRLVTCGEKWILYDTEKRTARCIDERDLTKEMKPHYKLQLLTVWWSAAGLIHYNFFKGPLTSASYCQELLNMHKKLLKYQKAMFYGRCPVLLQDDSRSYVKDGSIRSLFTLGYEVLTYPSRSQDLLPTEFHIFPAFNNFLAEQTFDCENIEGAFENFLRSRATAFFNAGMAKLKARWHKCYTVDGDYFRM